MRKTGTNEMGHWSYDPCFIAMIVVVRWNSGVEMGN